MSTAATEKKKKKNGCVDGGNRKKVDDEILSPAQLRRIGEYVDINRNGLLSAQFQ